MLALLAAGFTLNCLPICIFIFLDSHLTSPGFLSCGFTIQIPRVGHHQLKVVVVVDARRNVLVVLKPLVLIDATITRFRVTMLDSVGLLKCIKELIQDFLLGLFA